MAQENNNGGSTVLTPYFERFSVWACGAIIALLCIGYQDQKAKITSLDERVQVLFLDKVSKSEMKEVEQRIMDRIQAGNADILARIDILIKSKGL